MLFRSVNVKNIEYVTDDAGIVRRSAKASFKSLGKKVGKDMKAVAEHIRTFGNDQVRMLQRGDTVGVFIGQQEYRIALDDVEILSEDIEGWLVATEGDTTVALDTELTPALLLEGHAREFVNRVQNLRKKSGLDVTDRIIIRIHTNSDDLRAALDATRLYICTETLAHDLVFDPAVDGESTDVNELAIVIGVEKVS